MDAAIKHLRDGCVREGSALLIVQDSLDVVGGRDILTQLAQGYLAAVDSQRAQARGVSLLAMEKAPSVTFTGYEQQRLVAVVDAHALLSQGWAEEQPCRNGGGADNPPQASISSGNTTLDQLEAMLLQSRESQGGAPGALASTAPASEHSTGVVIDSVSQLLLRYPTQKVLGSLTRLQSHPAVSCILTLVHTDLHEDHVVSGLEYLSTCTVRLQPLGRLHREVAARHTGVEPHGCVSFRYKRRAGRVHVDSLLYTLLASGGISFAAPPPSLAATITAEALVALSVKQQQRTGGLVPPALSQPSAPTHAARLVLDGAAAAAPVRREVEADTQRGAPGSSAPQAAGAAAVAGGMRFGLTEQERQAKEQVRLPYEHQGQGKQYQTADYRDYLPQAAGGHGAAQHAPDWSSAGGSGGAAARGSGAGGTRGAGEEGEGAAAQVARLGHILYVRDSEEEHDSDEDPDDDLEI